METIILGAGPSLSSDIDSYPDWKDQFLVASSPMAISNINANLYIKELANDEKMATFPEEEKIFVNLVSDCYSQISTEKIIRFFPDEKFVQAANSVFAGRKLLLIYPSKYKLITYVRILRIFLVNLCLPCKSRRLYLMRSSITVALCICIFILRSKRIRIFGFCPEKPGYFFEHNSNLLKPDIDRSKLLFAEKASHINRNPESVRRVIGAFKFFASFIGVEILVSGAL